MVLIDTWNFTGYIDNAFYTAPFANVLLPCLDTALDPMIPGKNATHLFRAKAPLLKPDQTICILGESKEIGGWDAAKALPLQRIKDQPYFEIDLDLSECDSPWCTSMEYMILCKRNLFHLSLATIEYCMNQLVKIN